MFKKFPPLIFVTVVVVSLIIKERKELQESKVINSMQYQFCLACSMYNLAKRSFGVVKMVALVQQRLLSL